MSNDSKCEGANYSIDSKSTQDDSKSTQNNVFTVRFTSSSGDHVLSIRGYIFNYRLNGIFSSEYIFRDVQTSRQFYYLLKSQTRNIRRIEKILTIVIRNYCLLSNYFNIPRF